MAKWSDLAEEILGSEDKIQLSYLVKLNGKLGYIIMSNRKLLFLEEKDIIQVTYSKALELQYSNISEVNMKPNLMVIIGDKKEFNFTRESLPLNIIGKELQDLIAASKE